MKKKVILFLVGLVSAVFILLGISAYRSATELTAAVYEVPADVSEPIRIVQLTDLHGHIFGEDNSPLVELVQAQNPDLILMTGDMMDKSDENADVACALIEAVSSIAPVYYGFGNHETDWMKRTGTDLIPILTEAGAVVLESEYLDVEVNDQSLRIGGFAGYYGYPGMYKITKKEREAQNAFFEEFENTDRFKLLLSHIPTTWLDWGGIDREPVDLVLSGHYHGGQIRLPLIGGIYAPYVGLFPEYTEGIYYGEQATCILSTGLGSSPGIPRINNLPQVVIVDLQPENS